MTTPLSEIVTTGGVALTGATGFLGRRFVARLASQGAPGVACLVRDPAKASFEGPDGFVRVVAGDLDDAEALRDLVSQCRTVIHLAALTRAKTRDEMMRVNRDGTRRVAEAFLSAAPDDARFVHVSSLAAFGPAPGDRAIDEDSPPRPITWYGESKLASEAVTHRLLGDRAVILRPPAVYGPGERDIFTLFRMVRRRLAPIVGFGRKRLSLVFADDFVDVALRIAHLAGAAGAGWFVTGREDVTASGLVQAIERALGTRALKPRVPHALVYLLGAAGSCSAHLRKRPPLLTLQRYRDLAASSWTCDGSRLAAATGLGCPTGLEEGLARTVAWYRAAGWI